MNQDKTKSKQPSELRKQAEERLKAKMISPEKISDADIRELVYELHVHQIELEMQNEELRKAQIQIEESRQKYSNLYDFAPIGYLTLDEKGLIQEANLTAADQLGIERGLLINTLFYHYINREDRDTFYLHIKKVFESKILQSCEIRSQRKDGKEFYAQLDSILVQNSKGNYSCRTSMIDITEHKRAIHIMKKAVTESIDFQSALEVVLKDVCEATGWVLGEAWIPSPDGSSLVCSHAWYSSIEGAEKFIKVSEAFKFHRGVGLPGHAWSSGKPVWVKDLNADPNFLRRPFTTKININAAIAFPVLEGGEIVAVMVYFVSKPHLEKDERMIRLVSIIATQLGNLFQRKRVENELRNIEKKFQSVVQTAADAIILADSSGSIISWNKGAQTIFGYAEEEILYKPLTILMPERYREVHKRGLEKVRSVNASQYLGRTHEFSALGKDGSEFPIELTVSSWNMKEIVFYAGVIRDITERKKMQDELTKLATTDTLTGIFNRRKMEELLVMEMHRATRYKTPLSLIIFDIDHFKRINDLNGHSAGDSVLRTLVDIVMKHLRDTDYFCRWGGEEFLILCPETRLEEAAKLAERLRTIIANHIFEGVGYITKSSGVTQFSEKDTMDSFLKRADDALYRAKNKGRNRVEIADT